jgi:NDP-sugar pyrophosphorylase family protein
MLEALKKFKQEICDYSALAPIEPAALKAFTDKCTVALAAGGQGQRLKAITGENTHKTALTLPNGETMIERNIRMYKENGITDFVALVYAGADSVKEVLGNGEKLGVNVKYSYDPGRPVGRGGAVHNALKNGAIPEDNYLIVHNPDDQVVNFTGSFPHFIISRHLQGEKRGAMATVVVAQGTPYTFTGMKVNEDLVTQIQMYPTIPIPTHIGVTVLSPQAFAMFPQLFPLDQKIDFEAVIFPILAEKKQLFTAFIPHENWLSVNDPKAWQKLCEITA